MTITPDGAPVDSQGAAHRRWLITMTITVLFGVFGAVMAYLSYANSSKPAAVTPNRSPSKKSPSTAPTAAPPTAPTTPAAPAEATPDPAPDDKGKGHDKDK
jgi:hypothetical protein